MKKILLSLACAILLASCGSGSLLGSDPKMDSAEATAKVIECLKKNINFDEWKIYEIRWMEGESLENNLQLLSVDMINKGNSCFSQTFQVGGPVAGSVGNLSEAHGIGIKSLTFDSVKGITPEMIVPEAIQQQYQAAKEILPDIYQFKSISYYKLSETIPSGNKFHDRNKTFGKVEASFEICMIEPGKEYIESAGKKSIQYFEADFNVLPDGTVELDD